MPAAVRERIRQQRGETITLATAVGFGTVRGIPPGMNRLLLDVPSATLENISFMFTPAIRAAYFYDDSAGTFNDFTAKWTGRNTSITGILTPQFTTADRIILGATRRFRGLAVDVTTVNAVAATIAATVWDGGQWAALTVSTDGTAAAGATLAQDGLMSWTVPTEWAAVDLAKAMSGAPHTPQLYWVRLASSAALTNAASIVNFVTLANRTLNAVTPEAEGQDYQLTRSRNSTARPDVYDFDPAAYGGIEMLSASITSAANLTWQQVY